MLYKIKPLLLFLIIISFLSSCIDFETYEPYDYEYDDTHNEADPNANDLIINEYTYGHPDKETSFFEMVQSSDGGFFFIGLFDYEYSAGKLSADGNLLWLNNIDYIPKDVLNYKGSALVCGSFDKDQDGSTDAGYLELFDGENGGLLKHSTWVGFDNIRFNGLSDKYIVGRCREENSIHPFIAEYYLDENDSIIHGEVRSYPQLNSQYFHKIDKNFICGGRLTGQFDDIYPYEIMVYKFNENKLDIEWSESIIAEDGFETVDSDILVLDKNVFVTGSSEVYEELPPYDLDYWLDGLLASVTMDGHINYVRTYNASRHSDKYYHLYSDGQFIYACGMQSYYWLLLNNNCFSYGLISKIDPLTGDLFNHYSFGKSTIGSGISAFFPLQNGYVFAGWTNQPFFTFEYETAYQGWLAEIHDLESLKNIDLNNQTQTPAVIPENHNTIPKSAYEKINI